MTRRFRAPAANRAVLADPPFDRIPELVEQNRRRLNRDDVRIGGLLLRELRRQARAEVFGLLPSPLVGEGLGVRGSEDAPLLIAGHQPELAHPGVWVKNFALNGLAKKLGGVPLHLIADHDTMKSAALPFPTWDEWAPESVRLEKAAFDEFDVEQPWETRAVRGPGRWDEFGRRVAEAAKGWGYEPLLSSGTATGRERVVLKPTRSLPVAVPEADTWASRFTALRRHHELAWGCDNRELPVSAMSDTDAFRRFARHIAADADRFRHAYNSAVRAYRRTHGIRSRSHPVPDLADHELPFWVVEGTRRRAATSADTGLSLRPRALTLTLFARLCLGDFFIHGIGGGKYDEVTDAIIRDYFGVEPLAYQVLSATLHLPLPHFPATTDDVHRLHRRRRDLNWNPERFIDPREATEWKRRKGELIAGRPTGRTERRQWYREVQRVTREMWPFVDYWARDVDRELAKTKAEVAANANLRRRDYSWVLYPEGVLKPFLQGYLNL